MSKNEPSLLTRTRHLAEYAGVRALSALVGILPEALAVRLGVGLGRMFWLLSPARRRIARQNIAKAMPDAWTPPQLARLVRQVFVHIGLTAVEALWMRSHLRRDNIADRLTIDNLAIPEALMAEGRGVIAVTMHLGNWELMGAGMAAHIGNVSVLARPVNNPRVRAYTTRLREAFGMEVLSTRDGVRPMMRALNEGRMLGILIDQHVNRASVPVRFFGREAATTAVVASLALRMDVPVLVGYAVREGLSFRHRGNFEDPLELTRTGTMDADVVANTQRLNDTLEKIVRRHPEQWLWTHRRWKLADRTPKETH
jgi:Kdo2-lipid IVA lauroyltransferase/acyltransferase